MVLEVPKSQSPGDGSSQLHFLAPVAGQLVTRSRVVQTVGREKISTGSKWHKGSASHGLQLDGGIGGAGSSSMLLYFLAQHCLEIGHLRNWKTKTLYQQWQWSLSCYGDVIDK